jgi:hypothetical protein
MKKTEYNKIQLLEDKVLWKKGESKANEMSNLRD